MHHLLFSDAISYTKLAPPRYPAYGKQLAEALQPTADDVDSAVPGCERVSHPVLGTSRAAPLAAEDFHL